MTFDGNGVILQDGGATRYLATRPLGTSHGFARGAINFDPITDALVRSNSVREEIKRLQADGSPVPDTLTRYNGDPNGTLACINVNFAQKVYDPHLTVLQGQNRPSFTATIPATTAARLSWSFDLHYEGTTNLIRIEDTFYVYKLEFIR